MTGERSGAPVARDASLNVYLSTDAEREPGRPATCDWRACTKAAEVLVHLAEVDDGASAAYCLGHAIVAVNASVTKLWLRLGADGQSGRWAS